MQPKLSVEEDRESGIGSTLDLTSSPENYKQHNNHLFNKPSVNEAGRLPLETGTWH